MANTEDSIGLEEIPIERPKVCKTAATSTSTESPNRQVTKKHFEKMKLSLRSCQEVVAISKVFLKLLFSIRLTK